jgi:hypothetical protein
MAPAASWHRGWWSDGSESHELLAFEALMSALLVVLGLIFAPLAAVMAYVITYEEWSRHQLPHEQVVRHSMEVALIAFGFFAVASFGLGLVVPVVLGSH